MRRALRVVGAVVAAAVALVALAVGGTLTFARTARGGAWLRDVLVTRVNREIAGTLAIESLRLRGWRLELGALSLRTPEGRPVLEAARVEVAARPLALLRRRLVIEEVALERPALHLVQDARGLDLARALAPRTRRQAKPAPAQPPGRPSLSVALERLTVRDGLVEWRTELGERGEVRVAAIAVDGAGSFRAQDQAVAARLHATARAQAPLEAPIAIDLRGQGAGERGEGRLVVEVGGSRVNIGLSARSRAAIDVDLARLEVDPTLVRALAPQAPGPVAPLHLRGHLRRAGETMTANLELRAGSGVVRAEASGDPAQAILRGLRLSGHAVDLAALLRDGPRSRLDFTIDAHGHGRDLASLRGELKLDVPPAQLGPARAGPIRLHARADDDGYRLINLLAQLPGLSLRGTGEATTHTVNLAGTLVARDLAATMRAIAAPGKAPPLAGSGALALRVTGALARPRLLIRGAFPSLRLGTNRIEALDVQAALADLRRPLAGELRLQARRAQLGGRALREVELAVTSQAGPRARPFAARLGVGAPALTLATEGSWSADTLTLSSLRLDYPEAQWRLERPARLRFGGGFALDDLALAAGPQRIATSLRAQPGHVAATLTIARLDLARLPQALLPPALHLGGTVDVDAQIDGPTTRPRGHVRATIAQGRWKRLDGVAMQLDVHADGRRVAGTLDGRAAPARVTARFDLPAAWPAPDRAPLSLELDVPPFDVPAFFQAMDVAPPLNLRGRLGATAKLAGTLARPQGTVELRGERVAVYGESLGELELSLGLSPTESRANGREAGTELRLDLRALGGRAQLLARAPVTAAHALRLPRPALARLPFTIDGTVDDLPLRPFARLAQSAAITGGRVTMKLAARGPARAPTGTLSLKLADVAGPKFPPTDVVVGADAGAARSKLDVGVSRRGQTLATLVASLAAPAAVFAHQPALVAAPLEVRAHVGPLRLQRAALPTTRGRPQTLTATVAGELRVEGTLHAPRLALATTADEARLGDRALGRAELRVDYAAARPRLTLNVDNAAGGTLRATAEATMDLGYPAVRAPVDAAKLPITAALEARGLDLATFSELVDPVRTLGGRLDANARIAGTARAPAVTGRIEWKDGRLVIAQLGTYERIHLLLHADGPKVILDELAAHAGQGSARLTAETERHSDGLALTSDVRLEKFPLYAQGQPLAALTLQAHTTGTVAGTRINLTAKVNEARVAMAEGKRKKLQSLQRPADIVLLENGRPVDRAEARKQRRLTAARSAEPEAPSTPTTRRIRVAVEAPRNLWVEAPDAHLELGLDEGFLVTINDEPRVFGSVVLKRGRLDLLGKRFDVESGSSVRFTGPPDRPTLDVKADYEARTAAIKVRVALSGQIDHLDLQLSSPDNPNLGDTELLTVLATGRLPGEHAGGNSTPGSAAASVLGGVLAGQLQKALSKRLPLDVLVIEPGQGLSGPRLEAGTYLTDKLYVAYVGRTSADPFGRENRDEVQLEYQLTRRWSFEGVYGDARRGSADLLWTKNY